MWALAHGLDTAEETVTLHDGRILNRRQLYLEALRYDSTLTSAYSNLATCLLVTGSESRDETVSLQ